MFLFLRSDDSAASWCRPHQSPALIALFFLRFRHDPRSVWRGRRPGHNRCSTCSRRCGMEPRSRGTSPMPERRRAHRFALSEGSRALLRLMDDVYIECSDAAETTVIATQPVSIGEEILLELPSTTTRRAVTLTKAVRRTLVPYGGTLRHRVVLRRLRGHSHDSAFATADETKHAARM